MRAILWGHWKSRNEGFRSRWKRHIVVNSMQARLRAQLGDRPKYSGERRRRSVVVASIVLTITDPLRGSYPLLCNLQAALISSCGASLACMELTIISRFQRLQASTKYLLHSLFYCFSVPSILCARRHKGGLCCGFAPITCQRHVPTSSSRNQRT